MQKIKTLIETKKSADDLKKINQFTRRELTEEEVYIFTVALCDNDVDRDYEAFTVDALKALQPMFIGKAGIFDHMPTADNQNSRIFETWVEKVEDKKTVYGEDFYQLMAKAYIFVNEKTKDLIDEIDAGIKKEVSVSFQADKSVCSICGESVCEHKRGEMYDGKLCYFTLEEPTDAYEFSFVAIPAQRNAGVRKSFDLEKGRECRAIEKIFDGFGVVRSQCYSKDNIIVYEEFSEDCLKNSKLNDVVLKDESGKAIARAKDGDIQIKEFNGDIFINLKKSLENPLYIAFKGESKIEFERKDGERSVFRKTINSIEKVFTISVDDEVSKKSVENLLDGVIKKNEAERLNRLNEKKLNAKKQIIKSVLGG